MPSRPRPRVAIVHDYLTQRGGAERVVLAMARAFPDAAVHTSVLEPDGTFPEFASLDVRTTPLQRVPFLRRHHRIGLPVYPLAFARTVVDADVVLCSSSGFAHGVGTTGRKVVYCHNPPRWLHQPDDYLQHGLRRARPALALLTRPLTAWDRRAAASADAYLANATVVADRIAAAYGIEAEVLPPPPALLADGPVEPVAGLAPGFALVVSRLMPYKGVDQVVLAARGQPEVPLVVVGTGPERDRLAAMAGPATRLLGTVRDDQLRWLYRHAGVLVAAGREDFGLTPLEAAAAGTPTVALRAGGYLDTVVDGETGCFVDRAEAPALRVAIDEARARPWSRARLEAQAAAFGEARFAQRLHEVVDEIAGGAPVAPPPARRRGPSAPP